jgi:ComF family protein
MFKETNKFILDTLFPIHCLGCGKEGEWLCKECLDKIDILPFQVCPFCEKNVTDKGVACYQCKEKFQSQDKKLPIDALIVATSYKDNNISRLIHFFKYNFISDLHVPLGKILIRSFMESNSLLPDLIIPVPLHKKRIRNRGFNQSELLSMYVSQNISPALPIPVLPNLLERQRHTSPQMKIRSYSERQKNIRNAFKISSENTEFIKNKRVLIIDDVSTTGATIFECGKTLKQNGAKEVIGGVIARQEMS